MFVPCLEFRLDSTTHLLCLFFPHLDFSVPWEFSRHDHKISVQRTFLDRVNVYISGRKLWAMNWAGVGVVVWLTNLTMKHVQFRKYVFKKFQFMFHNFSLPSVFWIQSVSIDSPFEEFPRFLISTSFDTSFEIWLIKKWSFDWHGLTITVSLPVY